MAYTILPEEYFAAVASELPLFTDLLVLRYRGCGAFRRDKGLRDDRVADPAV